MVKKSSVAGILDTYGGLRVIVDSPQTYYHVVGGKVIIQKHKAFDGHVRPDEMLFVVPGFKVQEPVPWDDIPWMIRRVEHHIKWWIETRNDPDIINSEPIKMYQLRCKRTYNNNTVNLYDIVET
jgi:hypothetical protein